MDLKSALTGTMEEAIAVLKDEAMKNVAASQSKYGLKAIEGKFVPFLTPTQMAKYMGCSVKTLERWRQAGEGPPYRKITNRRIRYYIADVDAWLDKIKVVPAPSTPP